MALDDNSNSLIPLGDVLSHGLVAVSSFGLLSFFCSTSLFFYLTYRLISWRMSAGYKSPPNQFLLLIYNLLLADIQQACAFLLNISALRNNAILVGTHTCWAQGWFVSTGDLASSVFICGIAVHTFFGVVKDYRLPTKVFYAAIATGWVFVYAMGAVGPILHGREFYVRADAWCWINYAFATERLWLHYFWIFVAMFSTILIYTFIIIWLRTSPTLRPSSPTKPKLLHGPTPLMILYPLIYTICTAPLAAGRIVALAGHSVPLSYFVMAGTMIACNGWLDVLLYASTRADIVFAEFEPGEETGLETFAFMGRGHRMGTTTTIEAGGAAQRLGSRSGMSSRADLRSRGRGLIGREESNEHLYSMDQIVIKGEVSVNVDPAKENEIRSTLGTRANAGLREQGGEGHADNQPWDGTGRSVKSFEI